MKGKINWEKWRNIRAKFVYGKTFDKLSPNLQKEVLESQKWLKKKLKKVM